MLISFEREFIFIHIGKTAGSSITNALDPYSYQFPSNRVSRLFSRLAVPQKPEKIYFPVHSTCNYVARRLPGHLYERFFKFAFVRNPWDRLVSSYHYMLMNERHHRHAVVKALPDFEAFIRYEASRGKFHLHQSLCGKDGSLSVDFVGKYENLNADFETICKRIGVSTSIPHANKSSHKPYQEYYSDETRELVGAVWKKDIELFDYSFDA